jgi:hypothetical protein
VNEKDVQMKFITELKMIRIGNQAELVYDPVPMSFNSVA